MGTVASRQPSSTAMIRVIALLPCLVFVSAFPSKLNSISHNSHHSHHDEDVAASRSIESYLSPVEYEDEEVSASRVVDSYLIPVEYDEEPAASQAVDSYLVPDEQPAAQQPVRTFAKAQLLSRPWIPILAPLQTGRRPRQRPKPTTRSPRLTCSSPNQALQGRPRLQLPLLPPSPSSGRQTQGPRTETMPTRLRLRMG